MTLQELISNIGWQDVVGKGGVFLLLLMTLLQIAPIKINPWGWLAKKIGKAVNGEVIEKVDKIEEKVEALDKKADEKDAIICRVRILRFGDEILHGDRHSKDHFDQTLRDIDTYERYCDSHKNFENNITSMTIEQIKDVYQKQRETNDFL